ncbi:MAG: Protein of unknown function (DUF1553)/Protein of unknown function (DUF1549)/Planctomycete [Verrucomicrobiales bacterium]|nr:Protein of unknown function (DUF1553)/Protein of unknown function (DUF1549)/Planctomycete [Verrucomicrobiales bacterium]
MVKIVVPILMTVCLGVIRTAAAELTPQQTEFFEKKVRPVLVNQCYECHSSEAKKVKGGLLLDTKAGLLKGGDTSPALVPGDPQKSLLIKAIRWTDSDLQMPPKTKLPEAQITDLEAWVKMGAPDPRTGTNASSPFDKLLVEAQKHWAYQPIRKPALPRVKNAAAANPVDAFILEKLASNHLALSPRADKRTIIRRATFDLIGLPPTSQEVANFIADKSPLAFEKVIDRLLSSPAYGERWARHWLDVARYADNMGAIFNNKAEYPFAFTYRDYVIRAFNEDKPYNQFLLEQIAADLLPQDPADNRALAALGFLTVGRRHDGAVDDNVFDDRIDLLTRGLMGVTAGCARCHDHKLEPIATKDYYGLYGILRSCKEPEVYPELKPQPDTSARQDYLRESRKAYQGFAESYATNAAFALSSVRARFGDYLLAIHDAQHKKLSENPKIEKEILTKRQLPELPYSQLIDTWDKWLKKNTNIFSPWLEFEAVPEKEIAAQTRILTEKFAANQDGRLHPRVAQLFTRQAPASLKDIAALYNQLFAEINSEWQVLAKDALAKAQQLQPGDLEFSAKELEKSVITRILALEQSVSLPDKLSEELRQLLVSKNSPFAFKPDQVTKLFVSEGKTSTEKASKAFADLEKHPGAPLRAMALREDKPYDAKVFIRGNPKTPGPDAPRQFIRVLAGSDPKLFPKKSSGRLELAQAIASPENPLASRVFVNRVWQWHFGEGLVRTPSDFGFRGEKPSHPELLDYLAARFMEEGWSLKKLHRLLMVCETYQQSSVTAPKVAKADSENKLWSRMNPRPLEFEPFRDSMLAVAGRLDLTEGGRPSDLSKSNSTRRTIYAFVDRKTLPNLFRSFDFPDPNFSASQRGHTALTPQALYLLNSPFTLDCAKSLASCFHKPGADSTTAIRELYQRILQRDPTSREVTRALSYLDRYPEHDVVMPEVSDWQYGYGDYDAQKKKITNFTALKFTGQVIKGTKVGPMDLSNLEINPEGGQPAKDKAAIRRWIAPLDGHVSIYAELIHTNKVGDGVLCRLISSRQGPLGEWAAANTNLLTTLNDLEVKRGETLDFLTVCRNDPKNDTFKWAPTITMGTAEMPGMKGMSMRWDAKSNFRDPAKVPQPISPWEEFAQVLLLSNEFSFIE